MICQQTKRMLYAGAVSAVAALAFAAAPRVQAAAGEPGNNSAAGPSVKAQMRIDGVNGNNPTPIFAFSLGAANSGGTSDSGGGAGKVTFSNLAVSKMLDGDSVPLLQATATGQVLRTLVIDVIPVGKSAPAATYTFEDVTVTSSVLGSTTSAITEQDAFEFRRITSDVVIDGQTFHSCFDIKALTPCS